MVKIREEFFVVDALAGIRLTVTVRVFPKFLPGVYVSLISTERLFIGPR